MKRKILLLIVLLLAIGVSYAQSFEEMMDRPGDYNFYDIQAVAEAHFAVNSTERGSGYKPYKRWEMFMEPRVHPTGEIMNIGRAALDAYEEYIKSDYYKNLSSEKTHNGYWTKFGPESWTNVGGWNPGNGRVNRVAFHPTIANTMYAGTALGGLWQTTDGGFNWSPMTDGMPNLGVSGIAVHPTNPNTIYVLTGDGDGSYSPCTGVLKTTNGGTTWRLTDDFIGNTNSGIGGQTNLPSYSTRGFELIIHPSNGNILFAATTAGIFRTTNGGTSWENVRPGNFRDVKFRPGDPSTLYAVTHDVFWRSTDAGVTWTQISSGLPTTNFSRIAIGVSAANTNMVYLLYGGGITGFRGLYRSINTGTSFTLRSNSPNIFSSTQAGLDSTHQAAYDIAIAISPTDADQVVMGGVNTWRSTNGGTSWTVTSDWNINNAGAGKYCHADIHYLGYRGNILWVGSDGGVFRSADNGLTFANRSNGMNIMQFYKICTKPGNFYGGTQDNGTNEISSSGAQHLRGADGFACIAPEGTSLMYASSQKRFYRRNTNNTWIEITPDSVKTSPDSWNVGWIRRPGTSSRLFLGTVFGSVMRSTDSGDNWTDIGGNLGANRVYSLAMGNSNVNRLYIANRTTIQRSDDVNNATPIWSTIVNGLPANRSITGIAVDPNNSNRVYVSLSAYNAGQKVYQSLDAGANWTNISGTLPNVPVHCIVHDGNQGGLYIGTDIGIFYRSNNTGGWLPFMNGLPNTMVTDLEIRSEDNRIYAGTFGRGMWRSVLFSECSAELMLIPSNDPSISIYTGYQFYNASTTINSSRSITGGVGTNVTYRAGDVVNMLEGFEVLSDNEFLAELGSCNAVYTPLEAFVTGILEGSIHEKPEAISFDANLRQPIRAYPNPFANSFFLELSAVDDDRSVIVEIFDMTGRMVKSLHSHNVPRGQRLMLEIYGNDMVSGAYILRVREGEEVHSFKMIKQN